VGIRWSISLEELANGVAMVGNNRSNVELINDGDVKARKEKIKF